MVKISGKNLSFELDKTYKDYLKYSDHDAFYPGVAEPWYGKFLITDLVRFSVDRIGKIVSLFIADKEFQRVKSE